MLVSCDIYPLRILSGSEPNPIIHKQVMGNFIPRPKDWTWNVYRYIDIRIRIWSDLKLISIWIEIQTQKLLKYRSKYNSIRTLPDPIAPLFKYKLLKSNKLKFIYREKVFVHWVLSTICPQPYPTPV